MGLYCRANTGAWSGRLSSVVALSPSCRRLWPWQCPSWGLPLVQGALSAHSPLQWESLWPCPHSTRCLQPDLSAFQQQILTSCDSTAGFQLGLAAPPTLDAVSAVVHVPAEERCSLLSLLLVLLSQVLRDVSVKSSVTVGFL